MKRYSVIGAFGAALALGALPQLSAQSPTPEPWPLVLIPTGETVYDVVNRVTWLEEADLPALQRFGIPLCDASGVEPCINRSGSMNYASAIAWVAAMNAANYLGHSNWQLPTTPFTDTSCAGKAPPGNNFGFGCDANAMGYLYYTALGVQAPNTAVPIPANRVGPFRNFQPEIYWSDSPPSSTNITDFSFATGSQDGGTGDDFQYVLPMIPNKLPGTPAARGTGLQVNPDGQTIYDPMTNVTWLADANLAASDTFGLPRCQSPNTPADCVAQDGSMRDLTANVFVGNMNAYNHGAGYLGQTDWHLPPVSGTCPTYGCSGMANPMGTLYYIQFGLTAGTPVVDAPFLGAGPFFRLWPYPYWSCQALTVQGAIQSACAATGPNLPSQPAAQWSFSFGDGYLGTARPDIADHFVTAYFVGCDLPGFLCSLPPDFLAFF
jgi:hypothetical protein